MISNFRPVAIGPVTSVGNMYLGPFYYYFMAPWLLLSGFHPVGPAIGVGIISLATIVLIYVLGRKIIGEKAALFSAILFAFAEMAIFHARFSWNPNLAPLFTILVLYFIYMALTKNSKNWIWVGLCLGLTIQLHYVNLLLVGGCGLIWLYQLFTELISKKSKLQTKEKKRFIVNTVIGAAVALLTMTTVFMFDIRHNGLNFQAAINIFARDGNFASNYASLASSLVDALLETMGRTAHIVVDLAVPGIDVHYPKVITGILLLATFAFVAYKEKKTGIRIGVMMILALIITSIIGISFYRNSVFDHYILFAVPLSLMAMGYLLSKLWQYKIYKYVAVILVAIFIVQNASHRDFGFHGPQYSQRLAVAQTIVDANPKNEPFTITLFIPAYESGDHYGLRYQYLTSMLGHTPLIPEKLYQTQTLFIIDEMVGASPRDIINSPIYAVVRFGIDGSRIENIYQAFENGTLVYKLVK
jgi:uncharacterized membrane protein